MKIDLKPALYGQDISFDYDIMLDDMEFFGEKPIKLPVKIKGTIKNSHDIISIYADVCLQCDTSCARCLIDISKKITIPIEHDISYQEDADAFESKDLLNLDEIITPSIILSIDMAYLCVDDCKGLCQNCGSDLNHGDCSCDKNPIDDRLAILKTLLQ